MALWHEFLAIELHLRAMTHAEFAARVGHSAGTISRWLTGEEAPGVGDIAAIASALGMTREYLRDMLDEVPGSWARPPDVRQLLPSLEGRLVREVEVREDPDFNDPLAVVCGFWPLGSVSLPYLPPGNPNGRRSYIGHVTDQPYMQPAIRASDLLIIDEDAPWKPGDVVAGSFGAGPPHRHLMRVVAGRFADPSPRPDWGDAFAGQTVRLRSDGDGHETTLDDPGFVVGKVVMVIRDLNHDPEPDALAWFRRAVTRQYLPTSYSGWQPDRPRRDRGATGESGSLATDGPHEGDQSPCIARPRDSRSDDRPRAVSGTAFGTRTRRRTYQPCRRAGAAGKRRTS